MGLFAPFPLYGYFTLRQSGKREKKRGPAGIFQYAGRMGSGEEPGPLCRSGRGTDGAIGLHMQQTSKKGIDKTVNTVYIVNIQKEQMKGIME